MKHHYCGSKNWGHASGRHAHWGRGGYFRVPVNILKTDEAYELFVAAPGRNKEDFKISVSGNELTISYQKPAEVSGEEPNWVRYEYRRGAFERSFLIDDTVDTASISAKYEDGILRVTLPIKPGSIVPSQDIQIA
ncbi:MAG: Hsp20/alpha crystallin family protein [Saprospiraceae bacterium]